MNILITGSAGFIGFHLVKELKDKYKIIGVDNINSYYSVDLKYARLNECGIKKSDIIANQKIISNKFPNYYFYKTDIREKEDLEKIFKEEDIDFVIHLAAQAGVRYSFSHPEEYITNNQLGFFNIIDLSARYKIKKFVYASSSSIYGLNKSYPFNEEQVTESPASIYAATKKGNELLAHSYSHLYNMPTIGLRFFTVYGEWGRSDMAYFIFCDKMMLNQAIEVYNNGNMERDFTYIEDIIEGISLIIANEKITKKTNIYNIGRGKPEKLMDFIGEIEKNLNKKAKINFKPLQAGDVEKTFADISKIEEVYGYSPKTDISTGIKKFVNWYLKFYKHAKN